MRQVINAASSPGASSPRCEACAIQRFSRTALGVWLPRTEVQDVLRLEVAGRALRQLFHGAAGLGGGGAIVAIGEKGLRGCVFGHADIVLDAIRARQVAPALRPV